jgi:hypothetical protein
MDFRKATDDLCEPVSHEELARALGVSVATVRQARLRSNAKAHRSPPPHWEDAVVKIAENRIRHLHHLISQVEKSGPFASASN